MKPLIVVMGHLHNQLLEHRKVIEHVLFDEEKKFSIVLEKGLEILNQELSKMKINSVLQGEKAFNLYSTYGFPLEFTKNICLNNQVKVDEIGFNRVMLMHKQFTQKSSKFFVDINKLLLMNYRTDFVGYESLFCSSKVISLFKENHVSELLLPDELGIVILDKTPFYGESGGQVGDCGELRTEFVCFEVFRTYRYGQVFAHWGKIIDGVLRVGDRVVAQVNSEHRKSTSLHHSATHLLSSALSNVLGNHVIQKGSLITNQCLRFDFSHRSSMSLDQICLVENVVNQQIQNNMLIDSSLLSFDVAINKGAKSVFGKKYDPVVRVLSIGDFSLELCGGTHALRTGDIGLFIIFNEFGIASGVRRIEARCGMEALFVLHQQRQLLQNIKSYIKNNGNTVLDKVEILCSRLRKLEKELEIFRSRQIVEESERLIEKIRYIGNIKLIVNQVHRNINIKMLRAIVSNLKDKLVSGIVVVFFVDLVNMLHLVVGVTQDVIHYVNAIDIINYLNNEIGGSGGGRPCLAQSGGGDIKLLLKIVSMLDIFLIKRIKCYDKS